MKKIILLAGLVGGGVVLSATAFANNWLLYLPAILQNDQGGTDPDPDPPVILGEMNDTGITVSVHAKDDANYGRDKDELGNDNDGYAGFKFTKLDSNGDSTTGTWSCVFDNVTGLTWSLDQGEEVYSSGLQTIVDTANTGSLCGETTWRLPTVKELAGVVDYHKTSGAMIESTFFNDIQASPYWTSTVGVDAQNKRWCVSFSNGTVESLSTLEVDGNKRRVLLVLDDSTGT